MVPLDIAVPDLRKSRRSTARCRADSLPITLPVEPCGYGQVAVAFRAGKHDPRPQRQALRGGICHTSSTAHLPPRR